MGISEFQEEVTINLDNVYIVKFYLDGTRIWGSKQARPKLGESV